MYLFYSTEAAIFSMLGVDNFKLKPDLINMISFKG